MKDITKDLLKKSGIGAFKGGYKKAYIICQGLFSDIDYQKARKLKPNDNYLTYNVNLDYPNKHNFATVYKILDRILDEKDNILLFAEEEKIDLDYVYRDDD